MELTHEFLAVWMHDNYEKFASKNRWETQEKTKVRFHDLPIEYKKTMLDLAEYITRTFDINFRIKNN